MNNRHRPRNVLFRFTNVRLNNSPEFFAVVVVAVVVVVFGCGIKLKIIECSCLDVNSIEMIQTTIDEQ